MIDIKVQVVDGTFHEVDSNELAFKMAGIFAFKDAFKKAGMILLEPIMKVEVTTPDEYQGDLLGDISRRRGHIVSIEAKTGPDDSERASAAGRNVRLRHRDPFAVERPRVVFDGTADVRAGAEERARHDFGRRFQKTGGTVVTDSTINFGWSSRFTCPWPAQAEA